MLQLSKRVEYGLIALRHMAMHEKGTQFTAKELSRIHDLPYELLAKILQKMSKAGIIHSVQGVKGGYILTKDPSSLNLSSVIQVIEDDKPMITECYAEGPESCDIFSSCSIRRPLGKVQRNINSVFDKLTIAEII